MELLSAFGDLVGGALTLAKDIGKGGGGSEEEPNVCMVLLPVGLGVAYVALQSVRESRQRHRAGKRATQRGALSLNPL